MAVYPTGFNTRQPPPAACELDTAFLINRQWVADEEIADKRYIACKIQGRGLVVFLSCSHSGIFKVCNDGVRRGQEDLFGVVGGIHLAGKKLEERISHTVDDLKQMNPSVVIAGHCTGWRGKAQLATNFEGKLC
jgi:7,8-dihydropterin-6-yl-methyl-4-(beta-D-ribofuranosyl)aminobenzene 5'-phosphate synthase